MGMNVKENEGITIIELSGKVDAPISNEVRDKFRALIGQGKNKLVVDLEKVEYVDSWMLGVLVSGLKAARKENSDLKLAAIQEDVEGVFGMTNLNKVFDIFENQEEAVKAFQSGRDTSTLT